MKEKIQKIMSLLNYWFDNVMRPDGMKHFIVSICLTKALNPFMPFIYVFIVVLSILIAKELVCDKKMELGTSDPRDLLWGTMGMLMGVF